VNRHERRAGQARLANFKRKAHGSLLLTHLIAAADMAALDGHPVLSHAVSYWRDTVRARRPACIGCREHVAADSEPAAFLLAAPPSARTASISVFCAECWRDLPEADIERACARVLRNFAPGGGFLDAGRR
jgi:hypothetical protein